MSYYDLEVDVKIEDRKLMIIIDKRLTEFAIGSLVKVKEQIRKDMFEKYRDLLTGNEDVIKKAKDHILFYLLDQINNDVLYIDHGIASQSVVDQMLTDFRVRNKTDRVELSKFIYDNCSELGPYKSIAICITDDSKHRTHLYNYVMSTASRQYSSRREYLVEISNGHKYHVGFYR